MKKIPWHLLISFYLLLVLWMSFGCAALKKKQASRSDSLSVVQNRTRARHQETQYQEAQSASIVISHDAKDFRATIIPMDTFHYDPFKGFTGKARSVVVVGKVKTAAQRKDSILSKEHRHTLTDLSQQQNAKAKLTQKAIHKEIKRRGGYVTWLVLGLLVLVASFVLLKKFKFLWIADAKS